MRKEESFMSNIETDPVAKAFCSHKKCSFTPQTVYGSNYGVGGDIGWLQGRKNHHDRTHDHEATVVIYSPETELSKVVE